MTSENTIFGWVWHTIVALCLFSVSIITDYTLLNIIVLGNKGLVESGLCVYLMSHAYVIIYCVNKVDLVGLFDVVGFTRKYAISDNSLLQQIHYAILLPCLLDDAYRCLTMFIA